MANPKVSRKSADILLKWTATALRGALFARYNLGLPEIVRELPTELAVLEVRSEELDHVFVLADERALHLEFQTEKRANDLERFHAYDTGLYSLHKRKVVTVVFYGPGITSAPNELDGGSFVYRVHTIFLGTQQGEEVLARLREKRERGEVFGPEERADLILLSQMAQQRPLAEVLRDAVRLAPALPEEDRTTTLGAMIGIAYNRLDEDVARALLQEPEMTNVLEELVEQGYEQGLVHNQAAFFEVRGAGASVLAAIFRGTTFGGATKMGMMGTAEGGTDPLRQFVGGEQTCGLDHPFLAMQPLGLNGVQPRALDRQGTGEQAHALARLLDLAVVRAQPGAHDLAVVPGGVVPDQQHGALALGLGLLGTPGQKVDGHGTDRTAIDKAQPHLLAALRRVASSSAPGGHSRPAPWGRDHRARPSARSGAAGGRRPARRAGSDGPADSTRPRPQSPAASQGAAGPAGSAGRAALFFARTPGRGW